MLIIFQKDSCPYCKKVRDFMSDHDIEYTSVKSETGSASREILRKIGEKDQVPFLMDTSRGVMMYESDEIIEHVQKHYL
jgi:glutaredoxin